MKGRPKAGFRVYKIYEVTCAFPDCGFVKKMHARRRVGTRTNRTLPWMCIHCRERMKYRAKHLRRFEKRYNVTTQQMIDAMNLGRQALQELSAKETSDNPFYKAFLSVEALLLDLKEGRLYLSINNWSVVTGLERSVRRSRLARPLQLRKDEPRGGQTR